MTICSGFRNSQTPNGKNVETLAYKNDDELETLLIETCENLFSDGIKESDILVVSLHSKKVQNFRIFAMRVLYGR